ncbi:hypothetical protein SERLADRAFT_405860 [Serpula lacrymans var. lacrymans S7.9]|uniref:Uncharacterized protein n=1 Tax=Serpula lacrymans var. lacrymans (strain S7.9) TaxID=578457 RepID=F8NLP5_SERL9|nr:uncharacterized protein SERLADRAFT_405860 [Serpula lacrymans var. lacrymans S7.9]EGO28226.1 hypothetical protein SERLADRAFT_405860 [Serpula lacrymans var. lacrymans S7.9]
MTKVVESALLNGGGISEDKVGAVISDPLNSTCVSSKLGLENHKTTGVHMPLDQRHLVPGYYVLLCAHFAQGRVMFAMLLTHLGNSQVLFYPGGDRQKALVQGCIKYIFSPVNQQGKLCFAVQQNLLAPHGTLDPFKSIIIPSQPLRLLQHPYLRLIFVDYNEFIANSGDTVFKGWENKWKRIVLEVFPSGNIAWRYIPGATLEPTVHDEGLWPRVFNLNGGTSKIPQALYAPKQKTAAQVELEERNTQIQQELELQREQEHQRLEELKQVDSEKQ